MQLANSERQYGGPTIVLHWLMAVLVTAMVALGIYMVRLPDVGFDANKITLILIHKELDVLALARPLCGWPGGSSIRCRGWPKPCPSGSGSPRCSSTSASMR